MKKGRLILVLILFGIFLFNFGSVLASPDYFISSWNTSKVFGDSNVTLPIVGNFSVDWGDGNISGNSTYHNYSSPGVYTIRINGSITSFSFNNAGDKLKIINISQWGDLRLGNAGGYFYGCLNLNLSGVSDVLNLTGTTSLQNMFRAASNITTIANIGLWNTSLITSMDNMFYGATNFNQNLSNWDTGKVTTMTSMFYSASNFNGDISNWNTSNVTAMSYLFYSATNFNQNISRWNTSKATTFEGMFYGAINFNQDLSLWNTAHVTTLQQTFRAATNFDGNISNWDTSNVTTFLETFYSATNFNQNISRWNTSRVATMNSMFRSATSFNQNIGNWNVSNVSDMTNMFYSAINFNQNLSNWDTSKVTLIASMFQSASAFNGNISAWNVGKISNMNYMFYGATNFNQNLSNWDTGKVTTMTSMFQSASAFNGNISAWNTSSVNSMTNLFFSAINFNQNLSNWDTSKVSTMNSMFRSATSFNQNIGNWNVSNVSDMTNMFLSATLSTSNYDSLLNGWANRTAKNGTIFNGGNSKYSVCGGNASREILRTVYNWNITDGGVNSTYTCPDPIYPQFSNYQDNNATLDGEGIGLFNVTIENTNGTVYMNIDGQLIRAFLLSSNLYNANYTFNLPGNYLYNWTAYGNGTNKNLNISENKYYFVNLSSDPIYPQFSNYQDNNATLTNSGIGLFNVTLLNTNGTVWLEINNTNITATNLFSNVYNVSYNFTNGGSYNYRWYAYGNGTKTHRNNSVTISYFVNSSYPSTSENWTSPIGIPDPRDSLYFGGFNPIEGIVNQTTYCPNWPSTQNSVSHGDSHDCYYIDKTVSCNNANAGGYGTPNSPRCLPPEEELAAGAYVYINAGIYTATDSTGSNFNFYGGGTALNPIIISGNPQNHPIFQDTLSIGYGATFGKETKYLVFENLDFNNSGNYGGRIEIRPTIDGNNISNVVIRNCVFNGGGKSTNLPNTGDVSDGNAIMVSISSGSDSIPNSTIKNIVIYNVTINNYGYIGDLGVGGEECGIYDGLHTDYVWVLDSNISHVGADGIAGSHYADYTTKKAEHYFIGRNIIFQNGENCIDLKAINNSVVSENICYGPHKDENGAAFIFHYGANSLSAKNIWVLFNKVYNTGGGILSSQTTNFHVIGNLVYNQTAGNIGDPLDGTGIGFRGSDGMIDIVSNTLSSVEEGIRAGQTLNANTSLNIYDNIISNRKNVSKFDIKIDGGITYANLDYNLFYNSTSIGWGDTTSRNLSYMQGLNQCIHCIQSNPLFNNESLFDFSLSYNSPAIDSGSYNNVYQRFYDEYGLNISVGLDGITRPRGNGWDIGAYERNYSANKVELLNINGSINATYTNITDCANVVSAGQTCLVYPGVYNERVRIQKSGLSNNYILFKGVDKDVIVLQGFDTNNQNYSRIQGFNITYNVSGWLGGGIWLSGNYIDIVDNYFYDIPGQAITSNWVTSPNNIYISQNKMYKVNKGVIAQGNNWLVENNEVERLWRADSENASASGEDADFTRFFGENITFRNNYFHGNNFIDITFLAKNSSEQIVHCTNFSDCSSALYSTHCGEDNYCRGSSHVDGFQTYSDNGAFAHNIVIEGNIVSGYYNEGAMLEGDVARQSHNNILFRNNVFINSPGWIIVAHGITNLTVINNNFINVSGSGIGCRNARVNSSFGSTCVIKNNIFYDSPSYYWNESQSILNGSNNLVFPSRNGSQYQPGDIINKNPLFEDIINWLGSDGIPFTADNGLRLQNSSPAIDAGTYVGFSYNGNAPDIGAYESNYSSTNKVELLNINGSINATYTNITDCANVVSAGQTCLVYGGTYNENVTILNKANITIRANCSSGKAIVLGGGNLWNTDFSLIDGWNGSTQCLVFSGKSSYGQHTFIVRGSNSTVFRGLEITRENDGWQYDTIQNHGLALGSGSIEYNLIVENCYIHHHSGDGINNNAALVSENRSDIFIIRNNTLSYLGDDGISSTYGQITVESNYIDNGNVSAMLGGHPDGFQLIPNAGNVIIKNNVFRGFNQNIFIEYANHSVYLYNNILIGFRTNGTDRGMTVSARNWTNGSKFMISNNIFYNFVSFMGINGNLSAIAVDDKIVENNIFLNNKMITSDSQWLISNSNIYWDSPGIQYYTSDGLITGLPSSRYFDNASYQDPLFVNFSSYNFRLQNSSPAIDAGTDLSTYYTIDKDGITRPRGNGWDIGAYESNYIGDLIYPQFSNYQDNNATLTNSGIGLFNVTLLNTNGTVWLEINNTNITATNLFSNVYNVSYNFTNGGSYNYRWYAYGNGTNKNINVSADRNYFLNIYFASSNISLISPSNSSMWNTSNWINFVYNVSDESEVSNCSLIINGANFKTDNAIMKDTNQTFSVNLANGNYIWRVNCTNQNNAIGTSEQFTLRVSYNDSISPLISFVNPTLSNGSSTQDNYLDINVSAYEDSNYSIFMDFNRSLRLWMSFDVVTASGNPIDLSSYSINGTKQNDTVYNASGARGGCFSFDGNSDKITLPSNQNLNLTNQTISFWIKFSSLKTYNLIFETASNDYVGFYSGGSLAINWKNATGSSRLYSIANKSVLSTGIWENFALTYAISGNNVNVSLYRSGNLVGSVNSSQGFRPYPIVSIGDRVYPGVHSLNGSLDEFMVFSRVLDNQEIKALYNAQVNRFDTRLNNLTNGTYVTQVYAVDSFGNRNSTSALYLTVNTSLDIIYPQFSNYQDNNATLTNSGIGLFNVTLLNTNGTVWLEINNTNITATNLFSNVYNVSYNFTNGGSYNYRWYAYGNGTNKNINVSADRNYLIYIDLTGPQINIISPSAGSYRNNLTVFEIITNENTSWCGYSLNGDSNVTMNKINETHFNYSSILADGLYNALFSCNDSMNNFANVGLDLAIDTLPPTISLNFPLMLAHLNNSLVSFNYTPIGGNGLDTCQLWGNWTGSWAMNKSNSTLNDDNSSRIFSVNLSSGTYKWNVWCNSSLGSNDWSAQGNQTFTVDLISPNATILLPLNSTLTNQTNINFTLNNSDNFGLANATLYIVNSTNDIINQTTLSYGSGIVQTTVGIVVSLVDGIYNWFWNVFDMAGNQFATSNKTIAVDLTAPSFNVVSPILDYYNNQTILVNISVNDSRLDSVWFNYNGTDIVYTAPILVNFSLGSNTLNVYANDSVGNINSTLVSFNVDTVSPVITLITRQNRVSQNREIYLYYNVSDNTPIANCSLYVNGVLNQIAAQITRNAVQEFYLTDLGGGKYNYSITCFDSAGNSNFTDNRTFIIFKAVNFEGDTTNLDNANVSNVSNLILERLDYGRINFIRSLDLSNGSDFDDNIEISFNKIFVNSSALPELNVPAILKLYDLNFTVPKILKDGVVCSDCNIENYLDGTLTFNVNGFSEYTSVEQCSDGIKNGDETSVDCGGSCSACSSNETEGNTGSSSSSGGGSGLGVVTYSMLSDTQFSAEGYSTELIVNGRIGFKVANETYYVGIVSVNATSRTAIVNVSSTLQQKIIGVGEEWKVDVNADNYYDLILKLNNVSSTKANITIAKINEIISVTSSANNSTDSNKTNFVPSGSGLFGDTTPKLSWKPFLVGVIVSVILFLIFWFVYLKGKLREKKLVKAIRYSSSTDK